MAIHDGIKTDFEKMMEGGRKTLLYIVENIFHAIQRDFERIIATNEDDSEVAQEFRRELHGMVEEAKEELAIEMRNHIDNARRCKG